MVEEKIYDEPIKTQIEQHIIVFGIPTKKQLEAEILKRYQSAKARRDFVHHNTATNIYIYVYGTQEQASTGLGLWIGMLAMGPMDKGEPKVLINEARLASLSQQPEERMGLSEQDRRQVFREIAASERRAANEATARIPDSRIMEQIQLERELGQKYKMELARKYGLTEDQLGEITVEGVTMGWPRRMR